jgi:hypothetical protein
MTVYSVLLLVHSWVRWLVLPALLGRIGLAVADRAAGRPYDKRARALSGAAVGLLDVMLVIGLLLLGWFSPLTTAAMADMGSAMKDPLRRFWLVEHPTLMVGAVVIAHVATVVGRRATDPRRGHLVVAVGLSIALALVLLGIPWPFRAGVARPLFAL